MSGAVAVRITGGAGGRSGRDGQSAGRQFAGRGVDGRPREAGGPSPPRPVLLAAGVFAVVTIIGAGVARRTGAGHVEPPHSAVVAARDLWFDDAPAGVVVVRTRTAGGADSTVATLHAGEGMFVRGTLRALARGRRLDASGAAEGNASAVEHAPFRLTRYADGRLTLDDASTGAHLELRAFGPTNEAAFAGLLPAAPGPGSR
ncbi:hypothetical protein tb265_20550 [Gemmatimonadetes bacterium T265]|nr:hypothetical protein tb265_20550 [Gemmatimonadetes bacterium T265]